MKQSQCSVFRICLMLLGLLSLAQSWAAVPSKPNSAVFDDLLEAADGLRALRTLHLAVDGQTLIATGLHGGNPDKPRNIKSASKLLISAMVGKAIDKGLIPSVNTPVVALLPDKIPASPDPRLKQIQVHHLLSMQAGLRRTSGPFYGDWVNSKDWVRYVLAQPMEEAPGGEMRYSTGNTHLLSAILMRQSGRSTYELFNDWFARAGVEVQGWHKDPQGIPLGGNQVTMTPASLLAFGELYRRDGRTLSGRRVISPSWIKASWTAHTRSVHTLDDHGYGWFHRTLGGYDVWYGWGFGGQMLYVIPDLNCTLVMTSSTARASGPTGYVERLHNLVANHLIPVLKN